MYISLCTINPDDAEAYDNIVYLYNEQGKRDNESGKHDLAIEFSQRSVAIDSNSANAHYNLACGYSLKNEKDLSIESLQTAITLDKNFIEIAKTEGDFDNIRESPEFQQLINSQQTGDVR